MPTANSFSTRGSHRNGDSCIEVIEVGDGTDYPNYAPMTIEQVFSFYYNVYKVLGTAEATDVIYDKYTATINDLDTDTQTSNGEDDTGGAPDNWNEPKNRVCEPVNAYHQELAAPPPYYGYTSAGISLAMPAIVEMRLTNGTLAGYGIGEDQGEYVPPYSIAAAEAGDLGSYIVLKAVRLHSFLWAIDNVNWGYYGTPAPDTITEVTISGYPFIQADYDVFPGPEDIAEITGFEFYTYE